MKTRTLYKTVFWPYIPMTVTPL